MLRRRAAADAMQIAEEVQPQAVKLLPSLWAAKYVQKGMSRETRRKPRHESARRDAQFSFPP
jgi:hypothetical protein